jgi:hypothetical protein
MLIKQNGLTIEYKNKDLTYIAALLKNAFSRAKKYDSLISALIWANPNCKINPDVTDKKVYEIDNRYITIDNKKVPIEDFIKKEIDSTVVFIKDNIYINKDSAMIYIDRIIDKAKETLAKEQNNKTKQQLAELAEKIKLILEKSDFSWIDEIEKNYKQYKAVKDAIEYRKKIEASRIDAETRNIQKPVQKEKNSKKDKIDYLEIFKTLKDNVVTEDPSLVLSALGIDYKSLKNGSRYNFAIRAEKTPSVYMEVKGGRWIYKDFGTDESGDIISLVENKLNLKFKDALLFCVDTMGIHNPLEEINLDKAKKQIEKLKKEADFKKQDNIEKNPKTINSKVTKVLPIQDGTIVQKYLEGRGIKDIPKDIHLIQGITTFKNNEGVEVTKKLWGVGVLNVNGGADIHFTKKVGSLKSRVIGIPGITHIKGNKKDKVAVFEAKFDFAALMQKYKHLFKDINIIIANSASYATEVANYIKENELGRESVSIFGQNDLAGATFDFKVAQGVENYTKKIFALDYKRIEYGKDVNDLLLEKKLDLFEKEPLFTSFKITNAKKLEENIKLKAKQKELKDNPKKAKQNSPSKTNTKTL